MSSVERKHLAEVPTYFKTKIKRKIFFIGGPGYMYFLNIQSF